MFGLYFIYMLIAIVNKFIGSIDSKKEIPTEFELSFLNIIV